MTRRLSFLVIALIILLYLFAFPAWAADPTIFDTVPASLPPNVVSLGYQATSTAEFGDHIQFTGTARKPKDATLVMSTWAIHSDYPALDSAGYEHPITLNIYEVEQSGPAPALDALLYTTTQTFLIPWRPEPDPTCIGGSRPWRASDGNCYSGYAFSLTFDLSDLSAPLPDEIIFGIAYNTETRGYNPIGVAGPYNSLNVGLSTEPPIAGTNVEDDVVFWNTSHALFYADDGAGGVGVFRRDWDWTPYTPMVKFSVYPPIITSEIHDTDHNVLTATITGASVHAHAAISGNGGQPTGDATFTLFQTTDCSGTSTTETVTLVNGQAESSAAVVPSTGLSYQVSYDGDSTYEAAMGPCLALPVRPTIIGDDTTTFTVGQPGSFVVHAIGNPVPTLSTSSSLPNGLTFTDNGDGTGILAGTPATGTVGRYKLTFTASSGELQTVATFTLVVDRAQTIIKIIDEPDPSRVAEEVTVIFAVEANPSGSFVPEGLITVTDSDDNSCSGEIAAGNCTLLLTTTGSKVLTATYTGDSNFYGSIITTTHEVTPQSSFLPLIRK